jgi:hypothetical protein
MGEGNGAERRDGNMMTRIAAIETGEDTTIKPGSANPNESSGEIIQCPYFSRAASQEMFPLLPSIRAFNVERMLFTFRM